LQTKPIEGLSIRVEEFQENHKRLKADRLAREAGLKAKGK